MRLVAPVGLPTPALHARIVLAAVARELLDDVGVIASVPKVDELVLSVMRRWADPAKPVYAMLRLDCEEATFIVDGGLPV